MQIGHTAARAAALGLAVMGLLVAMLACSGESASMRISELPRYICPSATPRPTDTPRPTSPPTYPTVFIATLDYFYVDVARSVVHVQYLAQGVGSVQLSYAGTTASGVYWSGSLSIAFAAPGAPGVSGAFPVHIPFDVTSASLTVSGGHSYAFTIFRYPYPVYTGPNPVPCCLPPPIHPTPAPTYTPYPTPTPYSREDDYFLGDPVYTYQGPVRVRFRLLRVTAFPSARPDRFGGSQRIYVWDFEVRNFGPVEYALFPAGQMYVSEVLTPADGMRAGVWGASLAAAEEAGLVAQYDAVGLQPGQTRVFTLAAYGPVGEVHRISFALDVTARGGGPTEVPGRNIVSWLNQVNTICPGEIAEPR